MRTLKRFLVTTTVLLSSHLKSAVIIESFPRDRHDGGVFFGPSRYDNEQGRQHFPLWFEVWHPESKPKGILILQHGLREHIKLRPKLIRHFTDAGYVVAGFDLPGHGGSPNVNLSNRAPVFDQPKDALIPGWHNVPNSLLEFTRLIQKRVNERYGLDSNPLPTITYGHSLGGAFVQDSLMINATRPHTGWNPVNYAGAIISSPATDVFTLQKPLGPVFDALYQKHPRLPVFPLLSSLFWERGNPSKDEWTYYDAWIQELDRDQIKSEESYLETKSWEWFRVNPIENVRTGNPGAFHPLLTARTTIYNARIRKQNVELSHAQPPDRIIFPIALFHNEGDGVTNPRASGKWLASLPAGGERIIYPGALPHGNVESDDYLRDVLKIADAMVEEKPLREVFVDRHARSGHRVIDKITSCLGRLARNASGTPGYGPL